MERLCGRVDVPIAGPVVVLDGDVPLDLGDAVDALQGANPWLCVQERGTSSPVFLPIGRRSPQSNWRGYVMLNEFCFLPLLVHEEIYTQRVNSFFALVHIVRPHRTGRFSMREPSKSASTAFVGEQLLPARSQKSGSRHMPPGADPVVDRATSIFAYSEQQDLPSKHYHAKGPYAHLCRSFI